MEHKAESGDQRKGRKSRVPDSTPYTQNTASSGKLCLLAKVGILLIIAQIAFFVSFPQEARTQETIANEIPNLATRLEAIEKELISIDDDLASLKIEWNTANSELSELKAEEAKPKSFWRKLPLTGWRRRREIGRLYTRSRDLSNKIGKLQESRKPLIEEFVVLAAEFIEKSSLRIAVLGEAFLSDNSMTSEEAARLLSDLSDLWALTERTREARDKYAPEAPASEDEESLLALFSDDPADLQLWAAHLRDSAASELDKAIRLGKKLEDLEVEKSQLELFMEKSEEFQRRKEEREATGVGIIDPPWNDVATELRIENIKDEVEKLRTRKQKHEEKAKRYQQQAEQIEAEPKGKAEDD